MTWNLPRVDYPARTDEPMAITHVTLVPMDRETLLPDHTVVIEAGRVSRLGPSPQVDVAGLRVIDGTGKFLLPGLSDMHVHLGLPRDDFIARDAGELLMYLAHGVTLVRNMWGQPFHLEERRAVAAGELPGPRIVTSSPLVDGPTPGSNGKPILYRSVLITDPADAASLARRFRARGYDLIKAYGELSLDVLQALGRAGAEVGLPMAGHCPNNITFAEAADAGMKCFEHLHNVYNGTLLGGGSAPDPYNADPATVEHIESQLDWNLLHRLADRFAEEQIWNCPTATTQLDLPPVPQLEQNDHLDPGVYRPYLSPITAASQCHHPVMAMPLAAEPRAVLDARRRRDDLKLSIIKLFHDHGAPLLVGTDAALLVPGPSVHDELQAFVRAGLTPYQALRCATSEPARSVGLDGEIGTIAVGKRADLILVNANPLEDVAAAGDIAAVLANGYHLDRRVLDELLSVRAKGLAAALPAPDLPPPPVDANPVARGNLLERRYGTDTGVLTYAHYRLPDGGWVIDQAERSHTRERTARVRLTPALALQRAEVSGGTVLGPESVAIELLPSGQYRVTVVDPDGVETGEIFGDGPLAASDSIAVTCILPHLFGSAHDAPLVAIAADCDAVETHTLVIRSDDSGARGQLRITVDRPREPDRAYTVTLSDDNELRGITLLGLMSTDFGEVEWVCSDR